MSEYANEHYKKQKIDTVTRFKANHSLQDQIAVCEFMIDKYNTRDKGQSLDDIKKIRYYANWKEECYKQLDENKTKKTSPSGDVLKDKPSLVIGDRFEVLHNDYYSTRKGDIVQVKELDNYIAKLWLSNGNRLILKIETLSNSSKFKKLP